MRGNVKGRSQGTSYAPQLSPSVWQVGHSPLLLRDHVQSRRQPITYAISLTLRERLPRAARIHLMIRFILLIITLRSKSEVTQLSTALIPAYMPNH